MAAVMLLCLAPVVAAAAYVGIGLRGQVEVQSGDVVGRQAELAAVDMSNLVYSAKQLTRSVALLPSVRALDPACRADLAVLQPQVPRYAFIAVLDANGAIVCSSRPESHGLAPGMHLPWATDMLAIGEFAIGLYTAMPGGTPFLPIEKTMRDSGVRSGGAVVVGIDLNWMAVHLAHLWRARAPLAAGTVVVVTDRDGTILGRYPGSDQWLGRPLPEDVQAQVRATTPGDGVLRRQDSDGWLAFTVPPTRAQGGLATIVFTDGMLQAAPPYLSRPQAIVVFGGAVCLGMLLAGFAGHRVLSHAVQDRMRAAEERLPPAGPAPPTAETAQALGQLRAQLRAATAARNDTEAALRQAQRLQAVGQLAGGIAHDFNNTLATILGSLELMERRIPPAVGGADTAEAERLQALIERAIRAVQQAAELTGRLTAVSRRQRFAERPTDLNGLVDDLTALAAGTLGRGLSVETDPAAALWTVQVDASLAEAAIVGLFLTARTAMPTGGRLVIATGNVTHDGGDAAGPVAGDYAGVTIRGALQEMKLDEVRGLARACGGGVRVVGTPGQDVAATLLLPRAPAPAPGAVQSMAVHSGGSHSGRVQSNASPAGASQPGAAPAHGWWAAGLRVMVVDDDPAVRAVTIGMLVALGCEPVEASCADDALALLDNQPGAFGMMLIDYAMPGRNGVQLLQAVRSRGLAVPALLVTGHAGLADAGEAMLDGMLRKPFTTSELRAAMARTRTPAHSDT